MSMAAREIACDDVAAAGGLVTRQTNSKGRHESSNRSMANTNRRNSKDETSDL